MPWVPRRSTSPHAWPPSGKMWWEGWGGLRKVGSLTKNMVFRSHLHCTYTNELRELFLMMGLYKFGKTLNNIIYERNETHHDFLLHCMFHVYVSRLEEFKQPSPFPNVHETVNVKK